MWCKLKSDIVDNHINELIKEFENKNNIKLTSFERELFRIAYLHDQHDASKKGIKVKVTLH